MRISTFTNAGRVKTNEEIVARTYERLQDHPFFRGRTLILRISCDKSVLMINGTLPSFYLKQILQTVLCDMDGISQIQNEVEVRDPEDRFVSPSSDTIGDSSNAEYQK